MDKLPNDPSLLSLSREELMFVVHWKKKFMKEQMDQLGMLLGTTWTVEDLKATSKASKKSRKKKSRPGDKIFIPHALLCNPSAMKIISKFMPQKKNINGDTEIEDALGYDPIRAQQQKLNKELLESARSLLKS